MLYEGKPVGTPDAGAFWRVDRRARRGRAVHGADRVPRHQEGGPARASSCRSYDLSQFRTLFLAGERADPETIKWAEQHARRAGDRPLVADRDRLADRRQPGRARPAAGQVRLADACRCRATTCRCSTRPASRCGAARRARCAIKLPLPPGCLPTLWNADERFRETYLDDFPGYYTTADAGYIDEDGYVFVMARTDDIINVAGHRLSTGGMEEVLAAHPDVAECAVIGVADELKGQLPCGFVVLKAGVTRDAAEIEREVVALVRDAIGPVAAFKQRRRRSSACRRPARARSCAARCRRSPIGEDWKMPATIDDPAILDEITEALKARGIGV